MFCFPEQKPGQEKNNRQSKMGPLGSGKMAVGI